MWSRVTEIPFERLDPDGYNPFNPLLESVAFTGSEKSEIRLAQMMSQLAY